MKKMKCDGGLEKFARTFNQDDLPKEDVIKAGEGALLAITTQKRYIIELLKICQVS